MLEESGTGSSDDENLGLALQRRVLVQCPFQTSTFFRDKHYKNTSTVNEDPMLNFARDSLKPVEYFDGYMSAELRLSRITLERQERL